MCDTAGKIHDGKGLFVKNSDRCVNEPQATVYYSAQCRKNSKIAATYIEIETPLEPHAMLLSRPVWLWGGEIGVNECGVAIGNEAVFTKGKYGKPALTGMDLLRIGLESGDNAVTARDAIIMALEKYGQGGNCSYDGKMFYDNSFIIMDREDLFVLETYGREWAWRKTDCEAISNELILRSDADKYSGDPVDFKNKYSNPVKSLFVLADSRQNCVKAGICAAVDEHDLIKTAQMHNAGRINPMCQFSATGPCMHAGAINTSATTASMAAVLDGENSTIWFTGCSMPCISLYKPWNFSCSPTGPVLREDDSNPDKYWLYRESFNRLAIGKKIPEEFFNQKEAIQKEWIEMSKGLYGKEIKELLIKAADDEKNFYGRWRGALLTERKASKAFLNFWADRDSALNAKVASKNK